jgi:hypothetical protein
MVDLSGADKFLHLIDSFFLALVDPGLAVLAGLDKEIFDTLSGGMADLGDLVADALGILLATLLF